MKKIILLALAAAMMLSMVACAKNPRCTFDAAKEKIEERETVLAYDYESEKTYEINKEMAKDIISGEWTEASRTNGEKKVLSITVGDQYELCFFADGSAMIYSGLAGILERDRAYYDVKLNASLEEICKAVREAGEEVELEDDNKMPSAE